MTIHLSPTVAAQQRGRDGSFSVRALDLAGLGPIHSPVVVFDEFRVHGHPFPPHPHAGFSAVTYVFSDSEGGLRSRDSLGHDFVAAPGGLIWTQAGRGVIHHEVPAEPRPLHGLQLFVNTPARSKLDPPKTLRLAADLVPHWRSDGGDDVRVVVGSFGGILSPLVTDEPFTLLDVALHRELAWDLPAGHVAIAYVVQGRLAITSHGNERQLCESEAIALHGTGGRVVFNTGSSAQMLIVSAPLLDEPIVIDGPFIMNDAAQIEAALARYRSGGMGTLEPL